MENKKKALGLLITGATLLNVNSQVVFAEESTTVSDENNQKENIETENTNLLNEKESTLPIESESKTSADVTFYGKYDTLSEAQKKKTDKESEYKNEGYTILSSEITNVSESKSHEVFDHYELEVTKDAYTGKTKEEAEEIKSNLEKDSNVTAVIKEAGEVYDHDDVSDFEEKFENQDDANKIIKDLEDEGYSVSDVNYTYDTAKEPVNLDETFDTLDEANNALEEFKNEFTTTKEEITKVEDETEDKTETYSKEFNEENEANSYKETEEGKTNADEVYTAEIVENETETEKLNSEFNTRKEAEDAISEFESNHDVLDSESNIEEKIAGTIYNSEVFTSDMKTYEVDFTTYVIIKHGKNNVIWTEKELNADEQNNFIGSYKEHEDNVISYSKLKKNHEFISGYGENHHSGNGKLFTFYEEDGKTYIKMESGAESRVIAGEFQPVNSYLAKASGHNITYTVNVTKLTKGYDYKLVAEGEKDVTLASGILTGKKTKAVYIPVYNIDVSTKKEVYKTVFDDDYELNIKGIKNETEVVSNPKTSDNIVYSFILASICTLSLALCILKLKKSK